MASPSGGQWIFGPPTGSTKVVLGLNDGSTTPTASGASGVYNIEVFTSPTQTTLPTLDAGFQAGVLDPNGTLSSGYLTGNPTLFTGNYLVTDGTSPGQITLGSGNQTVVGAAGDTLVGGTGNQILNGITGPETVVGGSGPETIYGGVGDSIVAGSSSYVDGELGGMTITGPASGNSTIVGSIASGATADTISSQGTGSMNIQGLGSGDIVNLSAGTGSATVNATAGNNLVTLGGGPDTVYGGVGDTITAGSVNQYIDGSAGGMQITLGSGGTDNVIGSGGSAGVTITGGTGANFNYNTQVGDPGDLINLAGSTGNATINTFGTSGSDTVAVGNGSDSVWAGGGDRIGVGNATAAGGSHLFEHAGQIASAIGFGTNDSMSGSTATATIGTGPTTAVTDQFQVGTDYLFYQNESSSQNSAIVMAATSGTTFGAASTTVTLPDGSQLTLVGVTSAQLTAANTAGTLFKP